MNALKSQPARPGSKHRQKLRTEPTYAAPPRLGHGALDPIKRAVPRSRRCFEHGRALAIAVVARKADTKWLPRVPMPSTNAAVPHMPVPLATAEPAARTGRLRALRHAAPKSRGRGERLCTGNREAFASSPRLASLRSLDYPEPGPNAGQISQWLWRSPRVNLGLPLQRFVTKTPWPPAQRTVARGFGSDPSGS